MLYATASATGGMHVNAGQPGKKNNQDAIISAEHEGCIVGIICDGCSSQPHSEIGAHLGAHSILRGVLAELDRVKQPRAIDWRRVMQTLTRELDSIVRFLSVGDQAVREQVIMDKLLFTAMVVVSNDAESVVAVCGDGIVILDDEAIVLESPIPNTPAYAGYMLLKDTPYHHDPYKEHLGFRTVCTIQNSSIRRGLIVASDGLKDLLGDENDLQHPVLLQPKRLQRWLNVQTSETIQGGRFIPGRCPDDVSLIILRPERVQEQLLAEREEVAILKNKIAELETLAATIGHDKSQLEREYEKLGAQLAEMENHLAMQRSERTKIQQQLVALRHHVKKRKVHPALELFNSFAKIFGFYNWDALERASVPKSTSTGKGVVVSINKVDASKQASPVGVIPLQPKKDAE